MAVKRARADNERMDMIEDILKLKIDLVLRSRRSVIAEERVVEVFDLLDWSDFGTGVK